MGIINEKVIHKKYGEGIIISYENRSITVRFQQGDKKFIYPDAFDGYLTPIDSLFAEKIKRDLEIIKVSVKEEKEPQIKYIQREPGTININQNKVFKKVYTVLILHLNAIIVMEDIHLSRLGLMVYAVIK